MITQAKPAERQFEHELRTTGCVHEEVHVKTQSGSHTDVFIDCAPLFTQAWRLRHFYHKWIAEWFDEVSSDNRPEAIVVAAGDAVFLAGGLAQALAEANRLNIRTAWVDAHNQDFGLERTGFKSAIIGQRVLVIDDVIMTGASTMKIIDGVRAAGGEVIGVACMVNCTHMVTAETFEVPRFTTCWQLDASTFPAVACPMCIEHRPLDALAVNAGKSQKDQIYIQGETQEFG